LAGHGVLILTRPVWPQQARGVTTAKRFGGAGVPLAAFVLRIEIQNPPAGPQRDQNRA